MVYELADGRMAYHHRDDPITQEHVRLHKARHPYSKENKVALDLAKTYLNNPAEAHETYLRIGDNNIKRALNIWLQMFADAGAEIDPAQALKDITAFDLFAQFPDMVMASGSGPQSIEKFEEKTKSSLEFELAVAD